MRIVAALGGNALLQRGQSSDHAPQVENARIAAEQLAHIARQHDLVVTHGNGPQVGVLAAESSADPRLSEPYPFDTLVAQTQGMIGHWLVQGLQEALPHRNVVALAGRTEVRADDPAFAAPTKFIGEVLSADEAQALAQEKGWVFAADGQYMRRVVPSPTPHAIVEAPAIRMLVNGGFVVVCSGGGGIPVVRDERGLMMGVEAVVDKDLSAALLARELEADMLIIVTDVDGVYLDYGTDAATRVQQATPRQLRALQLPAGSMGPKVEAACAFVEATGKRAVIGSLHEVTALVEGRGGTLVVPADEEGAA